MPNLELVLKRRTDRLRFLSRLYELSHADVHEAIDVEDVVADLAIEPREVRSLVHLLAESELLRFGHPKAAEEPATEGAEEDEAEVDVPEDHPQIGHGARGAWFVWLSPEGVQQVEGSVVKPRGETPLFASATEAGLTDGGDLKAQIL